MLATFTYIRILRITLLLSTLSYFSSCSHESLSSRKTPYILLFGPIPDQIEFKKIKDPLTRSAKRENFKVSATLLTPPLFQAFGMKLQREGKLTYKERVERVNQEINHLFRYQTCFALTIDSSIPEAIELNFWKSYIAYGQDFILAVHLRKAEPYTQGAQNLSLNGNYRTYATLCSTDKIDISQNFTLVLSPKFRPKPGNIRLSWLGIDSDTIFETKGL